MKQQSSAKIKTRGLLASPWANPFPPRLLQTSLRASCPQAWAALGWKRIPLGPISQTRDARAGERAREKSKPQRGLNQALLNPSSEAGRRASLHPESSAMLCLPGPAGEPEPLGLSPRPGAPQPGGHSLADSLLQLNLALLTGDLSRLEHCCFPIHNRNICEKGSFIINL